MRPKLRRIAVVAAEGGYVLHDPFMPDDQAIWLSAPAWAVARMLDGRRTLEEFHAYLEELTAAAIPFERIAAIVEGLAQQGFLETPEALARLAKAEQDYLAQPVRPMVLAERSFPGDPAAFRAFIADFKAQSPVDPAAEALRGLVLPHLELSRVPGVYGAALQALSATPAPARVLMIGVAHQPIAQVAAALPLDLATPLGRLPVDREALDALAAMLPFPLLNTPLAFRQEHSIEFPAAMLHGAWPEAGFKVVPLIVGGVDDGAPLQPLAAAIAGWLTRYPAFAVASVDLSHVGARFGDPALDKAQADVTRAIDQGYLAALANGRFEQAFDGLMASGNPSRIDAYASVHVLRHGLGDVGEVLGYELSLEEESGSAVGAGAIAYR